MDNEFDVKPLLNQVKEVTNKFFSSINYDTAAYQSISRVINQIDQDISDAITREAEGIIRIGILGARGSGKSTFANALMENYYLPESAIIFCTTIPTTIRYKRQAYLEIESEIQENSYKHQFTEEENFSEIIKEKLNSVCKESNNPENIKKITHIDLQLPVGLLDGKEIVDVPGFTKGNPLHQTYAIRYSKYYCDICIVLINNAESVEFENCEGIAAYQRIFNDRTDSTIFIINKCDACSDQDIQYLQKTFLQILPSANIFQISAKNILSNEGQQYQYHKLLDKLFLLTNRKTYVLAYSLLERLIANFSSLRDLCALSSENLSNLENDFDNLLNIEFDAYFQTLQTEMAIEYTVPKELPMINIDSFNIPPSIGIIGPNDYINKLVSALNEQSKAIVNESIQTFEANFFNDFISRFDQQIGRFNCQIQKKISEFEYQFGVKTEIQSPKLDCLPNICMFDPSKFDMLKPNGFKLMLEKYLPGFLVRDLQFWKPPMNISVGPFSINLGIPIGIKTNKEMLDAKSQIVQENALRIMNACIYESNNSFVNEIYKSYNSLCESYQKEWKTRLLNYRGKISAAKVLTSSETINSINNLINIYKGFLGPLKTSIEQ